MGGVISVLRIFSKRPPLEAMAPTKKAPAGKSPFLSGPKKTPEQLKAQKASLRNITSPFPKFVEIGRQHPSDQVRDQVPSRGQHQSGPTVLDGLGTAGEVGALQAGQEAQRREEEGGHERPGQVQGLQGEAGPEQDSEEAVLCAQEKGEEEWRVRPEGTEDRGQGQEHQEGQVGGRLLESV